MTQELLPVSIQNFVDTVRSYFLRGIEEETLWPLVAKNLKELLAEESLIQQSKGWPET